jgi:hypothetical protein
MKSVSIVAAAALIGWLVGVAGALALRPLQPERRGQVRLWLLYLSMGAATLVLWLLLASRAGGADSWTGLLFLFVAVPAFAYSVATAHQFFFPRADAPHGMLGMLAVALAVFEVAALLVFLRT